MRRYAQCLLFLVHKETFSAINGSEEPGRKTFHSSTSPSPPVEETPKRDQMMVYAMAPYMIRYDDYFCDLLTRCGIKMLQTIEVEPTLTDGIRADRVEVIEIILDGEHLEKLYVNAEKLNEGVLNAVLVGHNIRTDSRFSYLPDLPGYTSMLDEDNLNILRHLSCFGTEIECRSERGGSLLHFAIKEKNEALVKILLDNGAQVDSRTHSGRTLLHAAVEKNHYKRHHRVFILKNLIKKGADVNATINGSPRYEGVTALHLAMESGENSLVWCLLENGASVDADSARGSVLQLAVKGDDLLLLSVLFRRPDVNNAKNQDVFRDCVRRKKSVEIMKAHGFRHVPNDAQDVELFKHALKEGDLELLNDLLQWGAAVYYHRSHALNSDQSENIREKLLTEEIYQHAFPFLLELVDSPAMRPVLMSRVPLSQSSLISILMMSGDLDLTSITDRVYLAFPDSKLDIVGTVMFGLICKMKALNLRVNKTFFENLHRYDSSKFPAWFWKALSSTPSKAIAAEAAALKNEMMGDSSISYHELLEMPQSKIVRVLKNKSVIRVARAEIYKCLFPTYSPIIGWRFRKALRRRTLIDKGIKMLNFLQPGLPDEVIEMIVGFLSYLDLMVFGNICELPAEEAQKA